MVAPPRIFLDTNVYIVGVADSTKLGKVDCFILSNHELIRVLAADRGDFECLNPEDSVRRYLEK